jgi:polyphosphate kinase 2 (PPK2 family)
MAALRKSADENPAGTEAPSRDGRLKRKDYKKELRKLQVELCRLQDWVKHEGLRVIIVFEGRDTAGKGGTIKAITERVSPRVFLMLNTLRTAIYVQPIVAALPGVMILVTSISFNLLSDGLRSAMEVK